MIQQCKTCGKDFKTCHGSIRRGGGKYCSRKCSGIGTMTGRKGILSNHWKGGKEKKGCEICGKEFEVYKYEEKTTRFCSAQCYGKWQAKNRTGLNSFTWKGGKILKHCQICREEFYTHPCKVRMEQGKFCSRSCHSIWMISHGKRQDTSIEIKMKQELTRRGIVFQKQYPIWQAKTIPDFFIAPNICIYCDGDYWHNLPHQKIRDKNQDYTLKFLGYKAYRFWEHEIHANIKECVIKIKEIKNATYRG